MSVTAKGLIDAQLLTASAATYYTAPTGTRTIIDKFTVSNIDSSSHTVTVNVVPSGGSVSNQNTVTPLAAVAANTAVELTELHNHILNAGDQVSAVASVASKLVIRMSGREIV